MTNSAVVVRTINSPVSVKTSAGTLFGYDIGSADPNPIEVIFYDSSASPTAASTVLLRVLVSPGSNAMRTTATGIAFSNGLWVTTNCLAGVQQKLVVGHVEFS